MVMDQFKAFVEEEGGWRVINGKEARGGVSEPVVQRLFYGIVTHYCRANDIDASGEVQTGSGLVDFKFSKGYSRRALTEVKLARNPNLLHGVKVQVPTYCKSSRLRFAYLGVVLYSDGDIKHFENAREAVATINRRGHLQIHLFSIDARPKESASKRKVGSGTSLE
jgi:hypothetical protein